MPFKHKIICCLVLSFIMTLSLIGCTSKEEFNAYRESVEQFYQAISDSDTRINTIDTSSENAREEFLKEYDKLEVMFTDFAEITVPDEFAYAGTLAKDAAVYMKDANALYHTAMNSNEYDSFSLSLANEKHSQALVRVNAIGEILQGNKVDESQFVSKY